MKNIMLIKLSFFMFTYVSFGVNYNIFRKESYIWITDTGQRQI